MYVSGMASEGKQTKATTNVHTRKVSAYEKLTRELESDQKTMKEVTLGKRVGLYRVRGELGAGNFSQVKMGIHALTKERVAIKILDKTKMDAQTQRLLSREIGCMERLHHPNIIRLYEVVETLTKLHIVMECATGGELLARVSKDGRLREDDAKPIFAQIVAAVQHMHEKEIVHRDLKAENVMFSSDGHVKVCDFGFSTTASYRDRLDTFCGSPPYAAPELFQDESYVGFPVDVWASGVILYFMVTGNMPFHADTVGKMKTCIVSGTYRMPDFLSAECQSVIVSILQCDPNRRVTMKRIAHEDWLAREKFPHALPPYKLSPHDGGKDDSSVEAQALLDDYGITDEHLEESKANSRSSVTGTYRIILHQLHKKSSVAQPFATQLAHNDQAVVANGKSHRSGRGKDKTKRRTSVSVSTKVCTIL